jgi:glyoxylase-like metal-dependent hydrolase (beta-lactamase superfamily II)
VRVRGREALLTHATNAHTDGDSWIYLADVNVIFTGDLFYNNGSYPMIPRYSHGRPSDAARWVALGTAAGVG